MDSRESGSLSAERLHALLAATLESSPDFVGLTDSEGRVIFVNAAGRRLAGLAAEADLTGISASTFHPPEVLALLLTDAIPVAVTTGHWEGESTLRTLDGELIPVSLAIVSHHADAARAPVSVHPFYLAMIMRDLRHRTQIENTLREGEALMRSVLDANPDCVKILSLDGRVETMNTPGLCLMEIDDPASLATKPWSAFWAVGHGEADARAALASARAGQQSRFQGFCPTAKGTPRWWDVAVTPVMDADNQPERILVVSRDVTKVREAERQRDRERDFLAAVLDNLFEGVVACDADGQLTLFNRATREFHGLPEVAIPPEDWAQHYALYNVDGVTPLERDDVPLYRAFRGEDVHDAEMVIAPTGKPAITVRASGRPLRGADGAITGAVVVMHDVTEHLKDLATQRQTEAQLRQAQKMEAVGQLAGGVAHDFNNLLTAITCSVDFLRDGIPLGHELRDDVDQIGDATERAAALTRQLLAFGRREMLQPRRIDPGAVIGALTRLLKRVLGPEVDLRLAIDPAAGDVLADPSHLEQVIVNLAINARDAMVDGGLLVIETEARAVRAPLHHRHGVVDARDYVLITVRDAGCGMDDATLARIFEPFFTTKGPGRGTGLGLATVFGIVTQSGGHVVVDSAVGAGTAFTLFLPRLLQDGAAAPDHMTA